ncbi:hypothetical protein HDV00_009714 [Rhizophlyctis rosea]|nr:hypothetical protein HDV00_009714 [Rhizophlyctis rosea]
MTSYTVSNLPYNNTLLSELPGDAFTVQTDAAPSSPDHPSRRSRIVTNAFWSPVAPEELPNPVLLSTSPSVLNLLNIDKTEVTTDKFLSTFSGNQLLIGTQPWSHAYGGHQFGYYANQLGDGRAISLAQIQTPSNRIQELQLKGAGRTPFSRHGDGLAVLRSSIREYLASELMHCLGVPTSRALSLIASPLPVHRETLEPAAIVTRVAPTWIRFGSFELHYYRKQPENVKLLADYVIRHHYPHLLTSSDPSHPHWNIYARFFQAVTHRTAEMIAHWQSVGFCHGVMNTDNMSILGITIDYGPFAFLDAYDPAFICNHSDDEGRYAFDQQPGVAKWNLGKLGETLVALLGAKEGAAKEETLEEFLQADLVGEGKKVLEEVLEECDGVFQGKFDELMGRKLGLTSIIPTDSATVIQPLLDLLALTQVDYTNFFRTLSTTPLDSLTSTILPTLLAAYDARPTPAAESKSQITERWTTWLASYTHRLSTIPQPESTRLAQMRQTNPKNVLRNWVAQDIIERVSQDPRLTVPSFQELYSGTFSADFSSTVTFGKGNETGAVDGAEVMRRAVRVLIDEAFEDGGEERNKEDEGVELSEFWKGEVPGWGRGLQCSCSS